MINQHKNPDRNIWPNYENALRRASWRKVVNLFRHRCNDLIPANEVLNQLRLQDRKELGLQEVPLNSIVGSTGRYRDFDLAFLPRHQATKTRWTNIARAYRQAVKLPPVLLYKVGDAYLVEDGNHRISVARLAGRKRIKARVIEIDSAMLVPEPSCTRLGFKVSSNSHHCVH